MQPRPFLRSKLGQSAALSVAAMVAVILLSSQNSLASTPEPAALDAAFAPCAAVPQMVEIA